MRHFIKLALLLLPLSLGAQTVTITGTVQDGNGAPYQNGTVRAVLVSGNGSGQQAWTFGGTNPVPSPQCIGGLDGFGHFTCPVTNTSLIDQQTALPQWRFEFNSFNYPVGGTRSCTVPSLSLSSSQDITSHITAVPCPIVTSSTINLASPPPIGNVTPNTGQFTVTNGQCNANAEMISQSLSDIGAAVNYCYNTVLGSTGGEIIVPASTSCQSFSIPIVLNTNHKNVLLHGQGQNSTCLSYTGSSGTALLVDTGVNEHPSVVRDMEFLGAGAANSTIGVQFGSINQGDNFILENTKISNFGNGVITSGANTFLFMGLHNILEDNGQNFKNTVAGGENNSWYDTVFSNTTTSHISSSVYITAGDWNFYGCSFDNAQLVIDDSLGTSLVSMFGGHFENPSLTNYTWIVNSNPATSLFGVDFLQDNTTTSMTIWIDGSGAAANASLTIAGGEMFDGAATKSAYIYKNNGGYVSVSNFADLSGCCTSGNFVGGVAGKQFLNPDPANASRSSFYGSYFDSGGSLTTANNLIATGNVQGSSAVFTGNVKSPYYISAATNVGSFGTLRMGNTESIVWRNAANSADVQIRVDGSNQFTFNGWAFADSNGFNGAIGGTTAQAGKFTSVTIGGTNTAPVVATPTVGQAACIYAAGPPVQIGKCTSVVGAGGACTCAP